MNSNSLVLEKDPADADLVAASLTGDRDAFGRIVARHQGLVCSLAYSGVGNLAQSEDLAQETFVTAWRKLPDLREHQKLRPWLCGIVRNLVNELRRKQQHEPIDSAKPLESANATIASEPSPPALAIRQEEQAILWREIEQIPESYREPLVLFYRQNQSVQDVAAALELSEEAVRQRLSRGRKLLHERMLAFVEETLERTAPGAAFTVNVMSAVASLAAAGKVATLSATAAKGATAGKATGLLSSVSTLIGPGIGLIAGWWWTLAGIKEARLLKGFRIDFKSIPSNPTEEQRRALLEQLRVRRAKLLRAAWTKFFPANCVVLGSLFLAIYLDRDRTHFAFIIVALLTTIVLFLVAGTQRLWLDWEQLQIPWARLKLKLADPDLAPSRAERIARRDAARARLKARLPQLPLLIVLLPFQIGWEVAKELKVRWTNSRSAFLADVAELATLLGVNWVWLSHGITRPLMYNATIGIAGFALITSRAYRSGGSVRLLSRDGNAPLRATDADRTFFEYRSRWSLLGLPLIHINYGERPDETIPHRTATGWIAVGTKAVGFVAIGTAAAGVFTIGMISTGVFSIGVLGTLGLFGIGLIAVAPFTAIGGIAIGYFAAGGIALGWQTLGGLALAWRAAYGAIAVSPNMAVGKIALASHMNDLTAFTFKAEHGFLPEIKGALQSFWSLVLPVILNVWLVGLFFPDNHEQAISQTDQKPA